MTDLNRSLSILADGRPVTGFRHARLFGRDALGLYPMPFTLRIWNLDDSDYNRISAAKEISVSHEDSILASGSVSDVYRRREPD